MFDTLPDTLDSLADESGWIAPRFSLDEYFTRDADEDADDDDGGYSQAYADAQADAAADRYEDHIRGEW